MLRKLLLLAGPAAVALAALYFYLTGGRIMSTDDAVIQLARTDIACNVAGQVAKIAVSDNQKVARGDPLFSLDDRPFQIAVREAEAHLADAKLQIDALKATYRQRQAERQTAQDLLALRQTELVRQKKLAAAGIASQAQLEQAEHAEQTARLQVDSAHDAIANVVANLDGNPEIATADHPSVRQAQAQLDRAFLNLSYTAVRAPSDGIVTKVEQLQVGDYITAAAPLFSLMSGSDVWAEANFKETELTHMRPGQSAVIEIDSYPGRKLRGRVVSITPGTGSAFSLLPAENASGNWVKVVQRLAVRIAFDQLPDDLPLRAGLSATVSVDTGHRRTLFGASAAQ
jgi:membrane fusion protein (multidrug efflux system)